MTAAGKNIPGWLSLLPTVGKSIRILLKGDNCISVPKGRMYCDKKFIHIGVIGNERTREGYPIISATIPLPLNSILLILCTDLEDENCLIKIKSPAVISITDLPNANLKIVQYLNEGQRKIAQIGQ